MPKHKGIIFVRSGNINYDSRIQKEIISAKKAGYNCTVLAWDRGNQSPKKDVFKTPHGEVTIYYYKAEAKFGGGISGINKFMGFNFWLLNNLKKLIEEFSTIHACDLDTALPCLFISKKYNKKLVYDIFDYYVDAHSIPTVFGKKLVSLLENYVIEQSDCTLICSDQRMNQVKSARPRKIEVIHNTPDINDSDSNDTSENNTGRIKVVYVGVLQNNRLLTEVADEIIKHQNLELHIGGYGLYENLFKDYNDKYENIHYYGRMEYKNVIELERKSDIMFATYNPDIANHKYSAPNKIYEALALGKPIIVCKDTGIDQLIKKEGSGLAIGYNAEEFIEAIYKLQPKEVRDEIRLKNKRLYIENYSWAAMEKKLLTVYEEL